MRPHKEILNSRSDTRANQNKSGTAWFVRRRIIDAGVLTEVCRLSSNKATHRTDTIQRIPSSRSAIMISHTTGAVRRVRLRARAGSASVLPTSSRTDAIVIATPQTKPQGSHREPRQNDHTTPAHAMVTPTALYDHFAYSFIPRLGPPVLTHWFAKGSHKASAPVADSSIPKASGLPRVPGRPCGCAAHRDQSSRVFPPPS